MRPNDDHFMQQALRLAALGDRAVAPNPMVGAVIVKDGRVIGRGYHEVFGGPHAEVNAVASVKNPADLRGATMYVTLEPCRHFGKTPPCADLLRKVGIRNVVAGSRDPFQKGHRTQDTGHSVKFLAGPVAEECRALNKFFFTWVTRKRPFISVKIAVSADGFVAGPGGTPVHLTTAKQDREVHAARALHQAILVGIQTVLNDDPRLTVRLFKGPDPLRVIVDSHLRIPLSAKVLKDKNVLIATTLAADTRKLKDLKKRGFTFWQSPTKKLVDLKKLFHHLASLGIASVLAETGPTLFSSLKKARLIDELIVLRSRKTLKSGLSLNK